MCFLRVGIGGKLKVLSSWCSLGRGQGTPCIPYLFDICMSAYNNFKIVQHRVARRLKWKARCDVGVNALYETDSFVQDMIYSIYKPEWC